MLPTIVSIILRSGNIEDQNPVVASWQPCTKTPRAFTPITTDKNTYNSKNKYYLLLHGGLVLYKKTYELLPSITLAFWYTVF